MKTISALLSLLFLSLLTTAQTLFTYGPYSVDAQEFIAAYKKNNSAATNDKARSMRDYLELYIQSKLKVRDAYTRKLDTLPAFRDELSNLRLQVIESYMTDPASFNKLLEEAFSRSQKDIRLHHIFIPKTGTTGASDPNFNKIQDAYKMLQKGQAFESVARQFSEDPSVSQNGGDLGYLTVFALPYLLENELYALPVGKFSAPFESGSGYHIFKNAGERRAVGRTRVAQILLAFPPGADEGARKEIAARADSLYQALLQGADFALAARQYSNDYLTASLGGQMTEFGLGTYDPVFENAAFALTRDGEISQPVLTGHGYHIIKRMQHNPVPNSLEGSEEALAFKEQLRYRVQNDSRIESTKDLLYTRVIEKAGFKETGFNKTDLWLYCDSLLDLRASGKKLSLTGDTEIFRLGNKPYTARNFLGYTQNNRYKRDGSGMRSYAELYAMFKKQTALDHYRDNLEDFNPDFKRQMTEFRDGNLFFEVMMQEVWTKSQIDTAGQRSTYEKNKLKYKWKESAGGIIFYCSDAKVAEEARIAIQKNTADWENIIKQWPDRITAESGRFEYDQIPRANGEEVKPNSVTQVLRNTADESASFAYIKKIFPPNQQKSFEEARGAVITDYQTQLDTAWVTRLKKKYPVKINEAVFKKISQ